MTVLHLNTHRLYAVTGPDHLRPKDRVATRPLTSASVPSTLTGEEAIRLSRKRRAITKEQISSIDPHQETTSCNWWVLDV